MATLNELADAVVTQLNAASLSQPLTAERLYQPIFDLAEMNELHVSVVPRGLESSGLDRNRYSFDYQIDVAVQKKTDMTPDSLDELMTLVEEIGDLFRSEKLSDYPDARCVGVKNEPAYAPEHLEELRQFTSVLTLTFRAWR